MKLASYADGSRDGQLVVVSRDLASAHYATGIATRLQQVLDDWNFLSPQLDDLYISLNQGRARHAFPFEPARCAAPLPRAFQWVAGGAFVNHVELLRRGRGEPMPTSAATDPMMAQGASDRLLGACQPIVCATESFGIDFEAGLAVVTGDVALGATPEQALDGVRLLMLANGVTLRHLVPDELAKGLGLVHSKPGPAFSPVAVTPDELGEAWRDGRVHLPLESRWNGQRAGLCDAGQDMDFHFGQLIAHVARTRPVAAGSIVGSGAVSNKDPSRGHGCIAEQRAIETVQQGAPRTGFMKAGDTIRIEMKGPDGRSLFGAIEQTVDAPQS